MLEGKKCIFGENKLGKVILGVSLFLWMGSGLNAQKSLWIYPEDGGRPYLVNRATSLNYYYGALEREKIGLERSQVMFVDYPYYLPGHIEVLFREMVVITYSDTHADMGEFYEMEMRLNILPNREINDAYLIIYWEKSARQKMKIVCPIGRLKADKEKKLTYSLNIGKDYAGTKYHLYFMSNGVEISSSETEDIETPWERYEKTVTGELKDGEPQPIVRILPEHMNLRQVAAAMEGDEAELAADGTKPTIKVQAVIDEHGYATNLKIKKEGKEDVNLAELAIESVQLWEFKPKIEKGKPVKSKVVIPFRL